MTKIKGLAPQANSIFEEISKMESIRPYILVGGTALSLQLGTRMSEDLDFMSWRKTKNEKREVDWPNIQKELELVGSVDRIDVLGLDHVEFSVNGVKISFYASPNYSPVVSEVHFLNNLRVADIISIGAMKMEVMLRRTKFRDYYDIYSLIMAGCDISDMINIALKYSGYRLKSKNIMALLTRGDRFVRDSNFENLNPIYTVDARQIEEKIIEALGKPRQ